MNITNLRVKVGGRVVVVRADALVVAILAQGTILCAILKELCS